MSRKALRVTINLDIETVSCPGVWLCPRGKVYLQLRMFDKVNFSKAVGPSFPLQFFDRLQYQKIIYQASSVNQLREYLSKTVIRIELIQATSKSIEAILAVFRTSVADLLYPICNDIGKQMKRSVSLLMDATDKFPGKLAPKIEVETVLVVDEMINYPLRGDSWILNPKTIQNEETSKTKPREKGKLYQKSVCHSKQAVDPCFSCKTLPLDRKTHSKHGSAHQFTRRLSEKENIAHNPGNFSTTTFTKNFADGEDQASSRSCASEICALCSCYEKKMEAVNRRSKSVPKPRYHSMPAPKYSKVTSPYRSKVHKSREDYCSVPCGNHPKTRIFLPPKSSKAPPKPHLSGTSPTKHYHRSTRPNTVDLSNFRDTNERFLASVLPDKRSFSGNYGQPDRLKAPKSFIREINPSSTRQSNKISKERTTHKRNEPKACASQVPESSKLKCCTNCYCIVCSKCKQKVSLDRAVCSACRIKN